MFKLIFIFAVVGSVPVFFLLTWVISGYHRLANLRERCRTTAKPSDGSILPSDEHNQAVARYEQARRKFPLNLIALLFRFAPADAGGRSK